MIAAALALLAAATAGQAAGEPSAAAPAPLRCPPDAPYDPANAFARIIRGELPVSLVAREELAIAFVPLAWDHPGHVLVVPTRPVRTLDDLDDPTLLAVAGLIRRVAAAQRRALGSTGYSIEQNNGRRQDVCHAHFHVIPNTPAVPGHRADRAEMDAMVARLRAALSPAAAARQ